MGNEHLLKRRIKVIGLYPLSQFKIGDVLCQEHIEHSSWMLNGVRHYIATPLKFPAIFRELKWYDMRTVEEMPKYISKDGEVKLIERYEVNDKGYVWYVADANQSGWYVKGIMPSTEEEYLKFKAKAE